jgi:hypothetical protein
MAKKETVVKDNGALSRRIRVMVSRQIDYAKVKIEFETSESLPDDADRVKVLTGICEELETLADDRISAYDEDFDPDSDPDTGADEGDAGDEDGGDAGGEEEGGEEEGSEEIELSEDLINSMEKAELVELCETTEGLEDIDTKKKVSLLRMLIIDALFEEGGEDDNGAEEGGEEEGDDAGDAGDDEWQDDDWQDD